MSLISDGIEQVRIYKVTAGIAVDGSSVNEPCDMFVVWNSRHFDKPHQVYINGELVGVTQDGAERSLCVPHRSCYGGSMRVDVFAVEPESSTTSHSDQINKTASYGCIELSWVRQMQFPFASTADIYSNNGQGQVDLTTVINRDVLMLWPSWMDKLGLGLCQFGLSDFGYDGSAAVGFGNGCFGGGEFGFDVDLVKWQSEELENGKYKFTVQVSDEFNKSDGEQITSEEMIVIRKAIVPEELSVSSYDIDDGKLILKVG
jgi:hypothetical protein